MLILVFLDTNLQTATIFLSRRLEGITCEISMSSGVIRCYLWGRLINGFVKDPVDPAEKVEIVGIDFLKKKDIKIIDPKYVFYGPCRPTHLQGRV